ncbi:MAG TPA: YARHG domain-containing protein, partial [Pyrinomonadaceae bacterium]|nr:YARHG domain-containing protein [Pyrinomonadaceae bacterium]
MRGSFGSVLRRSILTALLLITSSLSSVQAQDNLGKWESFDFAASPVELSQLKDLSLDDLKFLRGIVFGRHGRVFKDAYIQGYLKERSWYKPDPGFQNSSLSETERRNLDVIREAEARQHDQIE